MNLEKNLILIKGEDKTGDIEDCKYIDRKYQIKFKNSTKSYPYSFLSVQWLRDVQVIDYTQYRFYKDGAMLYNIRKVLKFERYFRVFFENGTSRAWHMGELEIRESSLTDQKSKDHLSYLRALAEVMTIRTEDGIGLLTQQYEKLNFIDEGTALATYLNPKQYGIRKEFIKTLIFPFGCNISQKKAVRNAIENSMSVIEGPPGTGKTQTILNIIANILLEGKTVAVVSNNNAATGNVLEKLQQYGLGFVAAYLGSQENKTKFIENQQAEGFDLPSLDKESYNRMIGDIAALQQSLEELLKQKNILAEKKKFLDDFILEKKHFEIYFEEGCFQKGAIRYRKNVTAKKLLNLIIECEAMQEDYSQQKKISWLKKWLYPYFYGVGDRKFYAQPLKDILPILQKAYYGVRHEELQKEYTALEKKLEGACLEEKERLLGEQSLQVLQATLAKKYNDKQRMLFSIEDLWKNGKAFNQVYPVILSTTHSLRTSLDKTYIYDYVIVDEASQVDLLTGVLAMSVAKKLVVVGDQKQLPNVINEKHRLLANGIVEQYALADGYSYTKHSLLSSIHAVVPNTPNVLLREHYRCHPKIIQFCNQKFYNNELIVMTKDSGEEDVLKVYKTVQGNHARGHLNQRQIDEVRETVLPELGVGTQSDYVGIITPYRDQTKKMNEELGKWNLAIDTVHKFQGREKDDIIIATVDNEISTFADDPNLLNVAVSRAKKRLRLVISDNEANLNTNIGDLMRYIRYQNCEVVEGKVYSVFDLLYKHYEQERQAYLKRHKRVSDIDSENLFYSVVEEILKMDKFSGFDVVVHQPLKMLIKDVEFLTEEELRYAMNDFTHLDFLVFRKVDKSPVLAIEVDGYKYHKKGTRQHERDSMKDSILSKYNIPAMRLSTIGSNEKEKVIEKLEKLGNCSGLI